MLHKKIIFLINFVFIISIHFLLFGCISTDDIADKSSFDPEEESTTNTETSTESEGISYAHSGSVGDGPIIGAKLQFVGQDGSLVSEISSGDNAQYSIDIPEQAVYPILIISSGGTDLVTQAPPTFSLQSVLVSPTEETANINPFTTLIVKTAMEMPGGLTEQNLLLARKHVLDQLNFGLDESQISDPIMSPIAENNVAILVKASEAISEMIKRTHATLANSGFTLSQDEIINALSSDLTDGLIDGIGSDQSNPRVAVVANIASAQILLELAIGDLQVNNMDAGPGMDSAILTIYPATTIMTDQVLLTDKVLAQLQKVILTAEVMLPEGTLASIQKLLNEIAHLADIKDEHKVEVVDAIKQVNQAMLLATTATDEQIQAANTVTSSVQNAAITDPAISSPPPSGSGGGEESTDPVIRVNAGGDVFVDKAGNTWSADYGYNVGTIYSSQDAITGTGNEPLFQTERWNNSTTEDLTYSFSVPNGNYQVNLHFANRVATVGTHVFDINIENKLVYDNLDITDEAGVNTALVKTFNTVISDGVISISLMRELRNPKINAIEIIPVDGSIPVTVPLVAKNDMAATLDNVSTGINVLANDTGFNDPANLKLELLDHSVAGVFAIEFDNTITYTPAQLFSGTESVTYKITDSDNRVATATLTVKVDCATCPVLENDMEIVLSWTGSTDQVDGYIVMYSTDLGAVYQEAVNLDLSQSNVNPNSPFVRIYAKKDLSLAPGDQVCFKIKSYNTSGISVPSSSICSNI